MEERYTKEWTQPALNRLTRDELRFLEGELRRYVKGDLRADHKIAAHGLLLLRVSMMATLWGNPKFTWS